MTTILIGISGSVRAASFNSALLRVAAAECPADAVIRIESIAAIPLYNGDDEAAHGVPPEVARLKDAIAAADGLLLVTPDGADISRAVGCTSGCGRAWLHLASLVEERGDLPGYLLEFLDLAVGGDEVRE